MIQKIIQWWKYKKRKKKNAALKALLFKCYRDAFFDANSALIFVKGNDIIEHEIKVNFQKWLVTNKKENI